MRGWKRVCCPNRGDLIARQWSRVSASSDFHESSRAKKRETRRKRGSSPRVAGRTGLVSMKRGRVQAPDQQPQLVLGSEQSSSNLPADSISFGHLAFLSSDCLPSAPLYFCFFLGTQIVARPYTAIQMIVNEWREFSAPALATSTGGIVYGVPC